MSKLVEPAKIAVNVPVNSFVSRILAKMQLLRPKIQMPLPMPLLMPQQTKMLKVIKVL